MNHRFNKIRSVLQLTIKEEPTKIRQDIEMSSPSRDSAKTAHKGKRRSFFGRVGRVFRRLLRHGKKKEVVSDPGEINAIPPETTNGEDIVPTSEKETEATRGTEHGHASEINIGPTSGTGSAHQQTAEELEFTTSESDQKSELQSTNATNIVVASEKETEATRGTEHGHASKINIGPTSGTDSAHQQTAEELEFTTSESDQKSKILSTNATDIVETVPTSTDGMESTVVENVAELKDGMVISIPSETASIPESVIEIVAATDIVFASETMAEHISSADSALDYAVLPRKESVPPLTTQKEPAEDKPRPSGGSVQHAQQNATPGGKRRSFFSKIISDIRIRKGASSKGTDQIQADVPVPLTVDSFKYHKLLGQGLYGKVFLASHPATDQLLAIKKVEKISAPFKIFTERQIQEMMGGNRFFPELYATFQTKKDLFYVMEYVNGRTLQEFVVKMQPLDINTIRFIAAELLCSIQALHSRGIIHHDLHIRNILIDSTGHIKIIDFGLSKRKELPYNPDITTITTTMASKEPWNDYLSEYLGFRHTLVFLLLNCRRSNGQRDPQLEDLIQECKCVRRNLRQHPFFAGINWKELEAGNVRPPYHMAPVPEVNRSTRIRVKSKRFMKRRRRRPRIDVPGFEFVGNRWREMLEHH